MTSNNSNQDTSLQKDVFAKLNQLFSENEEQWMEPGFVDRELNREFGLSAEEAREFHWDWVARKGNVNGLNYEERAELANLATEEAIKDGTYFTICQSCCWPILNTQKRVWHSMAAEGYICNDCKRATA